MTGFIKITEEDINNAMVYVDINRKEQLTRAVAQICVEPVDVVVGAENGLSLPPRVRENRKLRQQYQMGFLAWYLGREFKEQEAKVADGGETISLTLCMDEDEYDVWASSHVFNQLERLKKTKGETANRVFDILYDYKCMETMLSLAIRDELESRNDVFNRAAEFLLQTMTEDAMRAAMDEQKKKLAAVGEEAESYAREREGKKNG